MPGNLKVRTAAVILQFCLARGAFMFWLEYKIPQKSSLYANMDNDSSVLGSDQCYSSLITIKSNTDTRKTNLTLNRIPPLPAPLFLPTEPSFFQVRMCQLPFTSPSSSLPKLTFSYKILFLFYGTHTSVLFLSLHFSLLSLSKSFALSLPGSLQHSLLASCSPVSFPSGPSWVPLTGYSTLNSAFLLSFPNPKSSLAT